MADIGDIFFMIQFLGYMGLTLATIYNVITYGNFFKKKGESENEILQLKTDNMNGLRQAIMTFVIILFCFGIGFFTFMLDTSELLYLILFQIEAWILILNVALFLFELFIYLNHGINNFIKANETNKKERRGLFS